MIRDFLQQERETETEKTEKEEEEVHLKIILTSVKFSAQRSELPDRELVYTQECKIDAMDLTYPQVKFSNSCSHTLVPLDFSEL